MPILNLLTDRDIQRFHSKVDRSGGPSACWPWRDVPSSTGHGSMGVGGRKGRKVLAHHVAYELANGPIPSGLDVDHVCHNADRGCYANKKCPHRRCCNDAHLEAVTRRVNLLRGKTITARNAAVTHCRRGHPYSEANTRFSRKGSRMCKTCQDKVEFRKTPRRKKAAM